MDRDNNTADAKKTLKSHIKFLESLIKHIDGTDKLFKGRAMWTAWCLHKYINNNLMLDIEQAMKEHGSGHIDVQP